MSATSISVSRIFAVLVFGKELLLCRFMVRVFGTDFWYVCLWRYTVTMTHVPEIGAENPYQKSGMVVPVHSLPRWHC